MKFDNNDEKQKNIMQHSQQTIEELKKVLKNCTDAKTKNQILTKITELEERYGLPIEYLDRGENSVVFVLGDIVLKFGRSQEIKHPLCLKDIESLPFSKDRSLRVIPKMDTSDITEEDAQYVYNQLRKSGFIWTDAHSNNVGRKPNSGKDKTGLRIIDDEHIRKESQLLSAFDILASARTDMLIREYYYQKSINPKFKLSDIKKIMKSNYNITINPNDSLVSKYNLHIRESELRVSSAVIAHLKCALWNGKHEKDNVEMINMPGFYPKLYNVYDEEGKLAYVTKRNPMVMRQIKKTIEKGFLGQNKTPKLPSSQQTTGSTSGEKERFRRKFINGGQYKGENPQSITDIKPKESETKPTRSL